MHLVREVDVQGAAIDQELPRARHYPHPGDGLLAAAGAACVTGHHRLARPWLGCGAPRLPGLGGGLPRVLSRLLDLVPSARLRRDTWVSNGVFPLLPDPL